MPPPPTVGCHHLLSTIYCPPSSVICHLSSALCPLSSVTCLLPTTVHCLPVLQCCPPALLFPQQGLNILVTCHDLTSLYYGKHAEINKKAQQCETQPQPPSSPSSAPVPPSSATTVNNGPEPPTPTISTVDFTFFLQHASPKDIERFFVLASMTQEGRNLRHLWRRAFIEGVKQGIDETKSTFNQKLQDTNIDGFREGYDEGRDGVEEIIWHYEAWIEKALHDEWSMWKGHSDACFELPVLPSTRDFAVQSDPICSSPTTPSPTCDIAIQSDPICFPSTATSSTQTPQLVNESTVPVLPNVPAKLSGADDVAASLPPFIPSTAPRDLSCLRSERVHPFGALRQRDRRTSRQPQKPRNRKTFNLSNFNPQSVPGSTPHHSYPISFISSSRIPTKPTKHSPLYFSPLRISPSSHFDWVGDPCLFALRHALESLGWNRGVS